MMALHPLLMWISRLFLCNLLLIAVALAAGSRVPAGDGLLFWVLRGEQRVIRVLDAERRLSGELPRPPGAQILAPPQVSSDAQVLAYETISPPAQLGIIIRTMDGRELYRTAPDIEDRLPAVSADGSQIAFWSNRTGFWNIYLMSPDGSNLRPLTYQTGQLPYNNPIWSPDGSRIALRFSRQGASGYFISDLNDGSLRSLRTYIDAGGDFSWSPDGEYILFRSERDRNGEIYVYALANDSVRNLTASAGTDFQPRWSPDGRWIAFASSRPTGSGLYVMPTDCVRNGVECRATLIFQKAWNPNWSVDGSALTFTARSGSHQFMWLVGSDCLEQLEGCQKAARPLTMLDERQQWFGWWSGR